MSSKWRLFSTSGGISSSPGLFPSVMIFVAFSFSPWSKAPVFMSNSWNILSITSHLWWLVGYQAVVGNGSTMIVVFHFEFLLWSDLFWLDFSTSLILSSRIKKHSFARISLLTSLYALFRRFFFDCTCDLDTLVHSWMSIFWAIWRFSLASSILGSFQMVVYLLCSKLSLLIHEM